MSEFPPGRERQQPSAVQSTESLPEDFDWRAVCKCVLWKCPLCRHFGKRRHVPELECSICAQQVPKTSLMRCSHCRNICCVVCRLRVVSAKHQSSLAQAINITCCFCRHPYSRTDLAFLDLVYSNHNDQIGFKLWNSTPATSVYLGATIFNWWPSFQRPEPPSVASIASGAIRPPASLVPPVRIAPSSRPSHRARRRTQVSRSSLSRLHNVGTQFFTLPSARSPASIAESEARRIRRSTPGARRYRRYIKVDRIVGGTPSTPSIREELVPIDDWWLPEEDTQTQHSEIEAVESVYLFETIDIANQTDQY